MFLCSVMAYGGEGEIDIGLPENCIGIARFYDEYAPVCILGKDIGNWR
jgi:hypothetical protein